MSLPSSSYVVDYLRKLTMHGTRPPGMRLSEYLTTYISVLWTP